MELIIHRGTHQIGGNCVEVSTKNTRIIIDFGMPLFGKGGEPFDSKKLKNKSIQQLIKEGILPNIKGLYKNEQKQISAILITHSHRDHYGFLNFVHPDIDVYMSSGTKKLIEASNIFLPDVKVNTNNFKIIKRDDKEFLIGDFKINKYLVDHSGFDALAFLIEADGKRLFYSGDFRSTGRKRQAFTRFINNPPRNIDGLILEGTLNEGRDTDYETEEDVEKRLTEIFRSQTNVSCIFCSSQNIDRLVSIYKAVLRAKKTFVIDLYTAYVLDSLKEESENLPQYHRNNIKVKFDMTNIGKLEENAKASFIEKCRKSAINKERINESKKDFVLLTRNNGFFDQLLKGIGDLHGGKVIFSMWHGYMDDEFKKKYERKGFEIEHVHTSGHAVVSDLKKVCKALNPNIVFPIHTNSPDLFKKNDFGNVHVLSDGKSVEI